MLAAFVGAAFAAPNVACMPSYTQRAGYGKAAINEATTVWGRAWNLNGNTTYVISFGDGTANVAGTATKASGDATRSDYIGTTHTFTSAGSKTITITVTDTTGTTSQTAVVRVLPSPTHYDRVDIAIEKGLLYLYNNVYQASSTAWYWQSNGDETGNGVTGFCTLAFEENGHSPFNDPVQDVYVYLLQRAHTQLLSHGSLQAISNHSDGIAVRASDSNGNGKGAIFLGRTYSDCAVANALMNPFKNAAQAQTTYIPAGSPFYNATGVYDTTHPYSYYDLIVDFTDTLLWSQGDGSLRGGFEYILTSSSGGRYDGSAQQWPSLAMTSARDVLGISTPQWWLDNGVAAEAALLTGGPTDGIDYQPGQTWRNMAKSAGALSVLKADGMDTATPGSFGANLITFVQNNWNNVGDTGSHHAGWASIWYAMYATKKGMALQGLKTITVGGNTIDWYADLSGWLLGNPNVVSSGVATSYRNTSNLYGQNANGSWTSNNSWVGGSPHADTGVSVLVLSNTLTSPPPVAVIAAIPVQSTSGPFSVQLDGSGSYNTDPTRVLVEYLWDFDSSDGLNWTTPDATGVNPTISPAYLHSVGTHTITLRVKDNSTPTPQYSTATATITVSAGSVPPVAVPTASNAFPGYNAQPGATITLDGSKSYSISGDLITKYDWDLNGDGTFGDATGVTTTFSVATAYTGQIGLKVTANGMTSLPVYVDVQISNSNLALGTVVATNVTPGTTGTFAIPVSNDVTSGLAYNNVTLQLYNGDPLHGGIALSDPSAVTQVSLGVGETKTVTMSNVVLNGAQVIYAYIDPLNTIPESSKNDNIAFCYGLLPQTITFNPLATHTQTDPDFNLTASADSGLTVSYVSSNTAVATIVNGNQIHIVGPGTSLITASQAGNTTYLAAQSVNQLLSISRFTQVITFPALATTSIGTADYSPGATSNDPNATITYVSSNPAVATIVAGQIHIVAAGNTNITASSGADTNYLAAADVVQPLTVVANALQSVTPPGNKTYKESEILTFTVNYLLPVTVTGTPYLSFLEGPTGTTVRHATYVSGSGTNVLTFQYTVVSADIDTDGIVIQSPLNQNGGTMNNTAGGAAPLSFTPPATPNVRIGGMIYFTSEVNNAPDTSTGAPVIGLWSAIRSGMVMASNGGLAFRAHLDLTAPGVTVDNFQGIWKSPLGTSASTVLVARTGSIAPDTGNALYDVLYQNPYINDAAQLTFVGALRVNSGTPAVTTNSDSCLWSELGGAGLHKVLREGEAVAGSTATAIAPQGWMTESNSAIGMTAFAVKLANGGSALVRATAAGAGTFTLSTIVKQGDAVPGIGTGPVGTFDIVSGNSSDPRMNPANGDVVFFSNVMQGSAPGDSGIFYQPAAGGALVAVMRNGQATPQVNGDSFTYLDRPSYSSSTVFFRGFMLLGGQGIWKGTNLSSPLVTLVAKSNDTGLPGIPAGSKLWTLWAPFSNINGKVTFRATLMDAASAETRAIVTDTDGTLKVIAKAGDAAPGTGGTFVNFDNPVIGDGDQVVFTAAVSDGTIGIWRQAAGGGALSSIMKIGDTVNTSGGPEIISSIIIPGGASSDRLSEVKTVDAAGRVLVHATYQSGKTGILLTAP